MWSAITAIFTALAAWLEIRRVGAAYELSRKIENDIHEDETEILRLRALPDTGSQLAADRLRDRVARARGIVANLPAAGAPAESRPAGDDDAGDLHAGR
jgi:hypothetical protein